MGLRRWISSMKSTSPGLRFVSSPARSPGLSSTGPDVTRNCAPISLAMMFARVVLPSPGGPCSNTWSSESPRMSAALMKTRRLSTIFSCPAKFSNSCGRIRFSNSRSLSVLRTMDMLQRYVFSANPAPPDTKNPARRRCGPDRLSSRSGYSSCGRSSFSSRLPLSRVGSSRLMPFLPSSSAAIGVRSNET